ncbi:hypothetical protein [Scytonema sp. PCC 10023]|uniref:hypothetical protein n=1 Tax=Scytonema sp. PCC 10023 TaxID=1680591 RepID=UPI0039C5CA53
MSNFISTSRTKPCPVCGDTRRRCRELRDDPNKFLCMTVTDGYSTPPGFTFRGLTKDGTWGVIIRDMGKANDEARHEWISRWRHLKAERLKAEKERLSRLLPEPDRDKHIRNIFSQLSLFPDHRDDLRQRGLSDDLIKAGMFRSVVSWQKLDREISHQLAGVGISGRSLTNFDSGYLIPVWNEKLEIVSWQLRLDNPDKDEGKYRWASSRFKKKRPNGPTSHLSNGELPLTYCLPITGRCGDSKISNFEVTNPQSNLLPVGDAFSLPQYIGLAEGILKPWIISQLRSQIVIGAAGGNFGSSPETFKRYLLAAKAQLGIDNCQLILWADAGAVLNKNVMRQYRRTYELVRSWGYTLRVAWWGQLDKSCADPDEYTGQYELLTWAQFEGLSRNPSRFWDDVKYQLLKIKRLVRPHRGFQQQKRQYRQQQTATTIIYIPGSLPTPDQYIQLGCPKIIYQGDERVTIWKEAVAKGWQHILDKSAPGLGKSHTAGSMSADEFGVQKLWYLAHDHRNPTTLTVETNFIDLPPRHSGFASDPTRLTPAGQPFLVHPNGKQDFATTPGNCHRAGTFHALAAKNINHIQESDNSICLSCHLYHACRNSSGLGFGYRFQRSCVLQYPQVRAHPDSLPFPQNYQFSDCGIFWDEASLVMRSRHKIEVTISDFNQTVGELAVVAPDLFSRLKPYFSKLRFLLWGSECARKPALLTQKSVQATGVGVLPSLQTGVEQFGEGSLCKSDTLGTERTRYGYNDTAIRQLLGAPPDDLAEIINQLVVKLAPNLRFLTEGADSVDTTVGTTGERPPRKRLNKLFRSIAYQEASIAVDAVSLNWLVPLLKVWSGYVRGALHFNKGILAVHQENTRHRDVANAAQYNIYLDGTLDVRYLALKLGVALEDVLVIEQVTPQYENLTVVHITDMGVLGRDRRESMHQRLEVLRREIEKLSPEVAFIERKSYAKPGDGYHFRDSRGVNRFADVTAVASVGIPYPNIGELAAEYQVLTGKSVAFDLPQVLEENEYDGDFSALTQVPTASLVDYDITFEEFVDSCVKAEIIQESGRLRAHLRLDEQLVYYFIGDYDLGFLSDALPGIKLEKKAAVEISPLSGTTKQRAIWLVSSLFSRIFFQDKKPTQQEISQLANSENRNITQGRISQIGKEFGGWLIFKKLITELLSSFTNINFPASSQFVLDKNWIREVYLPLLVRAGDIQPTETIREVFQLISVCGWQNFRKVIKSVAIDVKATLLKYLLSILPQDILSIFIDLTYFFNEDSS